MLKTPINLLSAELASKKRYYEGLKADHDKQTNEVYHLGLRLEEVKKTVDELQDGLTLLQNSQGIFEHAGHEDEPAPTTGVAAQQTPLGPLPVGNWMGMPRRVRSKGDK